MTVYQGAGLATVSNCNTRPSWVADDCVPHTFEEFKAEHIREGYWESMLKVEGMTEEEFKADYIKRHPQDNAA